MRSFVGWRDETLNEDDRDAQTMNAAAFLQLALATAIFIGAGSVAKAWALNPGVAKFVLATLLYIAGNFVMMRLLRQVGMTTAFSVTNVLQLVVLNVIAIVVFGEKVGLQEGIGIALAILGVALISFAPRLSP
jgi:drug/metabolite transporter (DMT)-like permease